MARIETELMEGWKFAWNERSDEAFSPVELPHDWAVSRPFDRNMEEGGSQGFRSRFGVGWYRKELTLSEKQENTCYYLEFGGIYENSTVWVNDQLAGGRKYGYSTFALDVTEFLQGGINRIEVRVDNTQRPSDRWYSGAGIYRTVKLIAVEKEHFNPWEVVVRTQIAGTTAKVSVNSGLQGKTVRAELTGKGNSPVISAEGDGEMLELTVEDAGLRSAEELSLYQLH